MTDKSTAESLGIDQEVSRPEAASLINDKHRRRASSPLPPFVLLGRDGIVAKAAVLHEIVNAIENGAPFYLGSLAVPVVHDTLLDELHRLRAQLGESADD